MAAHGNKRDRDFAIFGEKATKMSLGAAERNGTWLTAVTMAQENAEVEF
jgi:hypothetical protein